MKEKIIAILLIFLLGTLIVLASNDDFSNLTDNPNGSNETNLSFLNQNLSNISTLPISNTDTPNSLENGSIPIAQLNILTKILNLITESAITAQGTIVKISGTLLDENDNELFSKHISLYVNETLIDLKETDLQGNFMFNWDTSGIAPGRYIINASFPGQTINSDQQTIILIPSYSSTIIDIDSETISTSSEVNEVPINYGNYNLITKDTAWTILNNDYITKYVDYEFVYMNETHYRVDWKWNDPYVEEMLDNCVLADKNNVKRCIQEASINSLTKGYVPPGIEKNNINSYAKDVDSECKKVRLGEFNFCKNNAAKKYTDDVNYDIDLFVSDYFKGKNTNELKDAVSYLQNNDFPKEVLKGNATFIGNVNPLKKGNVNFYVELKDGFYNSNGLRIKWGMNSILAEFNNSKTQENLSFAGNGNFSPNGNINRFIELPRYSNVTNAYINITGYRITEGTYTGIWFNITNYTSSISSIFANDSNLFISSSYLGTIYTYTTNISNLGEANLTAYYFTKNDSFFWRVNSGSDTTHRHYLNGTNTGLSYSLTSNGMETPTHITTNTTYFWINDYNAPAFDAIIHQYDISFNDLNQNITINGSVDGQPNSDFALGVNGMATDGTFIWIMDGNNRRVYKYYSNGTYYSNWSTALEFSSNNGIGIDGNYIWVGHYNANITKHTRSKFPDDVWMEVGTPNGVFEWYYEGNFNGTNTTANLATALNDALNNGACDCMSCSLNGDNCSIPVLFHADTPGVLEYSNIIVNHNTAPTFVINTSDESDLNSPTDKGLNVTFSANISDIDNDDTKLIICDSAGRYGTGCLNIEFCSSDFGNPGYSSCQFNTTSLSGIEYNWTSFICDNNSVCALGVNGTFYITRPKNPAVYVNGSQVWNYSGLFDGPMTVENLENGIKNDLIWCQDVNNSCNVSLTFYSDDKGILEVSLINIQYDVYDTAPPEINSISIQPNPVIINSTMNITVNATDNVNVTLVSASYSGASINLTYNDSTKLWKGTMASPDITGFLRLNITARDSSNLTTTNSTLGSGFSGEGETSSSCTQGDLCIQSIGESGKADLIIYPEDIKLSQSELEENDSVTINATIYNFGNTTASNFKVELQIDDVHETYNTITINNFSSTITSFEWNATVGNHTAKIIVDYTDLINESNETNNIAYASLIVEDITPPLISNIKTDRGSLNIKVNITDNQNISTAIAIVNGTEISLALNQTSGYYEGKTNNIGAGTYPMSVIVTNVNGLASTSQSSITVYPEQLDLSILQESVWLSKQSPSNNEEITINSTIYNFGANSTGNFKVELLIDGISKANNTITILGDGNTTTSFNWTTTFGNHSVKIKVDPNNEISETNESNNEITTYINVTDSESPVINRIILTEIIYEGSTINIKANVTDNVNVSKVNFSFNSQETILIYNNITKLYENSTTAPSTGTYSMKVSASDTNGLRSTLQESVTVYSSSSDISIDTGEIELSPENITENNYLNITIRINNNGGTDANNFKVELLMDGISKANNTISIQKANKNTTSFLWNSAYGLHNLTIKLDPENLITESIESNNLKNRTFFVLDITPPPSINLIAVPSNWTNQTVHNISWSPISDPNGLRSYEYRVNYGNWTDIGLNTSFITNLSEGIHTVYVRSTDIPGNIAEHSNLSVYIDLTPPNTPVIREWHSGSNWSNHDTPYFSWADPGDSGSGILNFSISIDGGTEIGIGYNLSYHSAPLISGIYSFKVRAYDGIRQASNWSNLITTYIDTTAPSAPTINSTTHPDNTTWYQINTPLFNISPISDNSGIQGYYYVFDRTSNTTPDVMSYWTTNTTINITGLGGNNYGINGTNNSELGVANGEWYMHILAKDNVGNIGTNVSHYKVNINVSKFLITNFSILHKSGFDRIFEYSILNSGTNNVTNINWSLNTGESVVSAQRLINLSAGENIKMYFANTYSNYGIYTITPSISSGTMSTSSLMVSPFEVSNLSILNSSDRKLILSFDIKNLLSNSLSNMSWMLDTKNNMLINSTSNFTLSSNERILVFVEYNYSSSGTFNINASSINGSFVDSDDLTAIIS